MRDCIEVSGCHWVCNLKRVGAVAKIDDEMIVWHVDLDAAVQQAHHRHVFQPQRILIVTHSVLCTIPNSVLVRVLTTAAVDARYARRAVSRRGPQQRQQTSVVAGEVPDVWDQHRVVDRFRCHTDASPAPVARVRQRR